MSDLVERLRGRVHYDPDMGGNIDDLMCHAAADEIERLTAELAETKRLSLADSAVISAQKQQLDRLVKGDKSPVAHAFQMQVNALTAERDAALAKVKQYEQALGTLHGDSLDAIMEVIGEGEKFASYNLGKSKMRNWFLRRISALMALHEPTP
jgi:hypothetical protein